MTIEVFWIRSDFMKSAKGTAKLVAELAKKYERSVPFIMRAVGLWG